MKPVFFATPERFRAWLEENHAKETELWVGYYKKDTGLPTINWSQSVDEALCFGWIDGIRKSIDAKSYTNRFTPRKPGSNWSAINIRKVAELKKAGKMTPAGLAAFERRRPEKSGVYTYENRPATLIEPYAGMIRKNRKAWTYIQTTTPGYRRAIIWWIVSAKREETRVQRVRQLITDSERGLLRRQFTKYVRPGVREQDEKRARLKRARS